ncbi:efflux transporter outer membrane subunit [Roseospirillum parvum]|uniref:efflux transporter outer membrane subunit n=1 Tax=Roseospirillum parvum TaxID=83401 RepID=UPI0015A0CA71|nr:efflux transporter outer membrane subunit [Roseospirillum parvum]
MPRRRTPPVGVLVLLLPALLGGCGTWLETPFEAPSVTLPEAWRQAAPPVAGTVSVDPLDPWWRAFDDAALSALVERALAANNDLAAATVELRKARLEAGLSERAMLPGLSAGADRRANYPLRGETSVGRTYSLSGALSYEVDLWGRLDREADAAAWAAVASQADREATALSLVGTTAELYWQVIYLTQRRTLARQSIDYTRRTLDLVRVQRAGGAASALEVAEAEQSVETQEADDIDLSQQLTEARNALAILFDAPPPAVDDNLGIVRATLPAADQLPRIDPGLPVDLLRRRPDLKAAEQRLRQSLATVDATRAGYLPTLTLTGELGASSISLVHLLMDPVGSLGAGLVLPFLNWNEMRLNIKVSEADYEAAVIDYRQTLYTALAEVENALSARRTLAQRAVRLAAALAAAERAETLYEVRYREGAAALQDWLDAQEKRRTAEESVLENRYQALLAQVTLYQALGGGASAVPAPAET